MTTVAIIGTRHPTPAQVEVLEKVFAGLGSGDAVISGCADGVDTMALERAHARGLRTIGCLPWKSYNKHVQRFCSELVCLDNLSAEALQLDMDSVRKYHPAPGKCTQGAMRLHARNNEIINGADHVVALPSPGGGGTGQGIRLAEAYGKSCDVYDSDGVRMTATEFLHGPTKNPASPEKNLEQLL